ncbi:MAG: hypothetical protein ACI9KE_006456 [Polyangiales bacterium]|jgi:hypothetical protein
MSECVVLGHQRREDVDGTVRVLPLVHTHGAVPCGEVAGVIAAPVLIEWASNLRFISLE